MPRSRMVQFHLSDDEVGLQDALCALSFFRHRHDKRPRFKKPTRRRNQEKMVSQYREYARIARDYIRLARQAGWRGSIIEAVLKKGG
jgi:hypothetical protein